MGVNFILVNSGFKYPSSLTRENFVANDNIKLNSDGMDRKSVTYRLYLLSEKDNIRVFFLGWLSTGDF